MTIECCTGKFLPSFLLVSFFILSSFEVSAQSKATLKLVFPFGDNTRTISVCPVPNRVIGGCCSDTNRIFTRDNKKGCCPTGNDIETVAGNQGCCYPVTAPQTRWGQTFSSPCGGYCAGGSAVLSYSTISSCCADCPHTDDVRAFMSSSKVCGTCCSKIPDNCGNAGYRVCEEATGSAYCSVDPTKCQPATDWIVGTSGQGGYSCCASCAGTRYAHTNSVCGSCCTGPNVMVSYNGFSSCCSSCLGNMRSGQTTANVCGDKCCDIMQLTRVDNGTPVYTTPTCSCAAGVTKRKLNNPFGYDGGYVCCNATYAFILPFSYYDNVDGDGATYSQKFNSAGEMSTDGKNFRFAGCNTYGGITSLGTMFGYDNLGYIWTGTAGIAMSMKRVSYYDNGVLAYMEFRTQIYCGSPVEVPFTYSGKRLGTTCYSTRSLVVTYTNNSRNISFSYVY